MARTDNKARFRHERMLNTEASLSITQSVFDQKQVSPRGREGFDAYGTNERNTHVATAE